MPNNFPGSSADESTAYIVAPYWSDVDARVEGDIFYEVHEAGGTDNSDAYLSLVSDYIVRTNDVDFQVSHDPNSIIIIISGHTNLAWC